MLTTVNRSALLMHSAAQMYELVNDVEQYPVFMEGCEGAEILLRGDDFMVARLDLRRGKLRYSFTTRNTLAAPESIAMELMNGPFKTLSGGWKFKALTERACKVSLALEFESMSAGLTVSGLFNRVANNLLDAVVRRADLLYGKGYA